MDDSARSNITWHSGHLTGEDRAQNLGARGATVWLTGLSGSGKSTVAAGVEQRLVTRGRSAYRLDGDNLRTGLNGDLGFSREDREENVRRAAEVALLFADSGVVAVVALISPYAGSRLRARQLHQRAGLVFVEVYMAAPVDVCARRDPKGLYAKASAGEIGSFTGVDDPYEVPIEPDAVIEPGTTPDQAVDTVLAALSRAEDSPRPEPETTTGVTGPPRRR
ncbi:MAG: adenylyl-sulfate kinase [Acidimicrobiales bacterium]